MKGWKIILASLGLILAVLPRLESGGGWAPVLLAAVLGFFTGVLWMLAELWSVITKKPFSAGLVVLWGGVFLVGTSIVTDEIFWGYVGAPLLLFGLAMWLHQRQRENTRYQEQKEQEQFLVIEEVTLIGGHSYFSHGGGRGALLGCLLGGPIGILAGLFTGFRKQINVQHFAVKYTNGRTGTEEHRVGSKRYRELMQYVHRE